MTCCHLQWLHLMNACIVTYMHLRVSHIALWAAEAFCDLLDRFLWYVFRLGRSVTMSVYISARVVICNAFIRCTRTLVHTACSSVRNGQIGRDRGLWRVLRPSQTLPTVWHCLRVKCCYVPAHVDVFCTHPFSIPSIICIVTWHVFKVWFGP